jgi:hypothetical protein
VLFAGGTSEIAFSQEDATTQILIDYDTLLPDSPETFQAGLKRTLSTSSFFGEVFSAENTVTTFSAGSSGQIEQRTLTHTQLPSQQQFAVLLFYLQVTLNQFLPAGTYTDSIDLNVYTSGSNQSEDSIPVDIEVLVSQFVGLNAGDINVFDPQHQGGYGMDFETLQSFESLDEYIPYQFSFAQSLHRSLGQPDQPGRSTGKYEYHIKYWRCLSDFS